MITLNDPGTIFLGGDRTQVGNLATSEVLVPGMGIERFNAAGVVRWRKATADSAGSAIATNQSMLNMGVNGPYAIGDLVEASILQPGASAWVLIASGLVIAAGDKLGHAGDGTFKKNATVTIFTALENKTSTSNASRVRVEAV